MTSTRRSRRPVAPPGAAPDAPDGPDAPSPRPQPAGRVLVMMVVALALAGLMNAESIARKSSAQNADSWRADVAEVFETLAGPLTWPRDRIDVALGRTQSSADVDELLAGAATGEEASSAPATTLPAVPELRTPTAEEPLRLYVGGDSMAQEFAKSMERVAASTGVIVSTLDPQVATGLARPDHFNWPARLAEQVVPADHEALVLLFGANDAQGMELADGTVVERFSEPWLEEYRRRVAGTMDLLRGEGQLVFWVGMPIMDPAAKVRGQDMLNHIYWSEAESRPWVVYVDSWAYFADGDGNYAARLPSADGSLNALRQPDGVHWSKSGADRIAWQVLSVIEEYVNLSNGVLEYPPSEVAPPEVRPRDEVPKPASPD